MSTLRLTIRWLIVLLIVGGSVGGAYLYNLWREQDRLLTRTILEQIAEKLPHWDIQISRARFDWSRRIHVHDMVVRDSAKRLIARFPEIVIIVDRQQLTEDQSIVIEDVEFRGPELHLFRQADGRWNLEDLLPVPPSQASLPDWKVSGANLFVRMEHAGAETTQLGVTDLSAEFVSSGRRRFSCQGRTTLLGLSSLEVSGECDLDRKEWTVSGHFPDLTINEEFLDKVARLHPAIRHQLLSLDSQLAGYFNRHSNGNTLIRPGGAAGGSDELPDLGVAGKAEIDFRVTQWGPDVPPEFKVLLQLSQMQISNSHLPLPLHDLSGKFYVDQRQVLVRGFSARNGITSIAGDATIKFSPAGPECQVDVTASDVVLDKRLYNLLPESWRRLHDSIQPSGHVDISCRLERGIEGRWKASRGVLIPKECTAAHVRFPYPIRRITGSVRQTGPGYDFEYDLKGSASGRVITLKGYTKNAGPEAESLFTMDVQGLPIDSTFKAACAPQVRQTLDAMKLEGVADLRSTFFRPAGPNQSFQQKLAASLRDGAVQCDFFPLRLDQLSGVIDYSSETRVWAFSTLKAHHGHAVVEGDGRFSLLTSPGELDLSLTVKQAHFDKALEIALPESVQRLWDTLSPSGRFHALAKIHWVPGRPVDIELPVIKVYDAGLVLEGFPVPLDDVVADLSFRGNRLQIKSFRARHDQTRIRADGFATVDIDQWRVRLEQVFIDDLVPDRVFRLALPESLRTAVEQLDPRGELSLSGMLDFRGTGPPKDYVTAAWDVRIICSGNSINAGLELQGVRGSITAFGVYDGTSVRNEGQIALDSVSVLDHQLNDVRGPYRINDEQLIVGSKKILSPNPGDVSGEERILASAIGGQLSLDAVAVLGATPSYRLIASISNGSMQEYARLYLPGENTLRGVVNGWIDLHGRADSQQELSEDTMIGRGQLKISPAALYELPVIVQIFKVMSFVPPDRTAFNYALVDFDVNRGSFWFKSIDLVGDAVSLRGKGSARFDGRLDLDFYSMLGRNSNPRLPVFDVLINTATTGWVGIEVDGYVSSPRARLKVAPTIDDTLRRFLGSFNSRLRPPVLNPSAPFQPIQQSEAPTTNPLR